MSSTAADLTVRIESAIADARAATLCLALMVERPASAIPGEAIAWLAARIRTGLDTIEKAADEQEDASRCACRQAFGRVSEVGCGEVE